MSNKEKKDGKKGETVERETGGEVEKGKWVEWQRKISAVGEKVITGMCDLEKRKNEECYGYVFCYGAGTYITKTVKFTNIYHCLGPYTQLYGLPIDMVRLLLGSPTLSSP